MKSKLIIFGFLMSSFALFAQSSSFEIILKPTSISELGGIQSFAYGQYNGYWLIVGGRLDGLHRRQPWAAFDSAGHNTQIIVVNPSTQQKWTAPLTSLSLDLQEQLCATNMEFYQSGNFLYVIGGYGYSPSKNDHVTYDKLTAINVSATIDAVIKGNALTDNFRQIKDAQFQVTGGRLDKIYDTYFLVGGHKFMGRYNPMSPSHGTGFIQKYTDEIRKFKLLDDGKTLTVQHFQSISDTNNLHRRDYNVTAQILPNGQEGLTAFSGVFQKSVNLPFLNSVTIDSSSYRIDTTFSQYYNHYHCAHFPIYSAASNEMHTVFFGGIAQYYDSLGTLVENVDVPFVKTIARVTRNSKGEMAEYKLPIEMPAFLGAGSELIRNNELPIFPNRVIKYDELDQDSILIGHIYGGISSSAANIFWINEGLQSSASNQIFEVILVKNPLICQDRLNEQSTGSLKLKIVSSITRKTLNISYTLAKDTDVQNTLSALGGKVIEHKLFINQRKGINSFEKKIKKLKAGSIFLLTVDTGIEKATQIIKL